MTLTNGKTPAEKTVAQKRCESLAVIIGLMILVRAAHTLAPSAERLAAGRNTQAVETAKGHVCVHTLLENEVEEKKILRSLKLVRELGAATIVQFFPWAYVETRKTGQFQLAGRFDRIVRHAERQGLAYHRAAGFGAGLG